MRFQVPQFIEVEDKIFGPLTIKQFIYIAGGAGLSFIFFRLLPLPIAIILMIVVIVFVLALAFYQINNRPLLYVLQSAFGFLISNKLYLWKKTDKSPEKIKNATNTNPSGSPLYVPKLSQGKLHDLTWSLDIKENVNGEPEEERD